MSDTDDESDDWGPGMLTATQRDYLRGELDVEPGSQRERTIRSRIRERVANTVFDLVVFQQNAEERDIEQISKKINLRTTTAAQIVGLFFTLNANITPYLKKADAESYDGFKPDSFRDIMKQGELDTASEQEQAEELMKFTQDIIYGGISDMFNKQGYDLEDLDVNIDITIGTDLESLSDQELDSLTERELARLYQTQKITEDEFISAAAKKGMFDDEI